MISRILLLLAFLLLGHCKEKVHIKKAIQGEVNLEDWDPKVEPILQLDGEWEFYWKELPSPNELKAFYAENTPAFHEFPYAWTDLLWKQKNLPAEGFATFRVKVKLPSGSPKLAVLSGEQGTAYRLFSGRVLVLERGKVGTTKEESTPDPTGIYAFLPGKKNLNLTMQISNFHHRAGGPWSGILIGDADHLKNYWMTELVEDAFSSGILIFLALYHFAFFYLRKNWVHIIFSSFLLAMFLRLITTGNKILAVIFPIIPFDFLFRFEYLGFYFGSTLLYHFLHSFFPEESSTIVLKIMYGVSILFSFSLFFDPLLASQAIPIYQIFFLVKLGFAGFTILFALYRSKPYSFLICLGAIFCMLTAINDILHSRQFIQTGYLIHYGVLLLVSTETLALSMTLTKAFMRVEVMKADLEKTNQAYQRFIPKEFLKFLGRKNIQEISLGDQTQRVMTILFSDIRDFTALSEKMSPDENFQFLNSYLKRMSPLVTRNHGFIDKYIGDGIMALFPKSAEDGLKAAIQMQEALNVYNQKRVENGLQAIRIGIGLHTGKLILGTIGSDNRMDGTVISDAVNLSARLESLTKYYGVGILISGDSFQSIENSENYGFRILDIVKVKGKTDQITVIHVYNGEPEEKKELYKATKDIFERGLSFFWMQEFNHAKESFQKVLDMHPDDKAAKLYLTRSEYYSEHPLPPDWDGSFSMLEK
jgi:adenylate cyclase